MQLNVLVLYTIFLHPSKKFFIFFLIVSVIIRVNARSWMILWLCIEINLILFIPLIFIKNNKYRLEATLKYFLVQAVTSLFIIVSSVREVYKLTHFILLALLTKAGAAPLHQWVPRMVEGVSWTSLAILFTVQKIIPLCAIRYIWREELMSLFLIFIFFSRVVGSVGGLRQRSLRKLLTYSRISHLSWLLRVLILNFVSASLYFLLYSFISLFLFLVFFFSQVSSLSEILNSSSYSFVIIINFLSLGGLPPFLGFFLKILVIQTMLDSPIKFILVFLLFSAFVRLFFYLRVCLIRFYHLSFNNMVNLKDKKNNKFLIFNILNTALILSPCLIFI